MTDVTSLGDVNADIITSNIKEFPPKDAQILLDDLHLSTGGCAANSMTREC